jgi:hypothetical protein
MPTFPTLRPRQPASGNPAAVGGIARILAGAFGSGAPVPYVILGQQADPVAFYHKGDIFEPGAEAFVFEPAHELPIQGILGQGSDVNQGTHYPDARWPVFAADIPLVTYPLGTQVGYGGLQAGAFVQQPLLDPSSDGQ